MGNKTKTLQELVNAGFTKTSDNPRMYFKEDKDNVALYKLKISKLDGDLYEEIYHGKKEYYKNE